MVRSKAMHAIVTDMATDTASELWWEANWELSCPHHSPWLSFLHHMSIVNFKRSRRDVGTRTLWKETGGWHMWVQGC